MINKWNIGIFFITTFFTIDVSSSEEFPRIVTPLGTIRGYYKISAKKQQYEAYESIPYAMPPIEDLRFEPPVPIEAWTNELNATKKPNICLQFDQEQVKVIGHEDCLYLNIYVRRIKNSTPLPVIVYFHGGGFQYGYSLDSRPTNIIDKDVIFVTINYRLGPFGFLSTNDKVLPGNMGLKDQSLALKWISNNIKYFGGDSKRITLTGCSAGGSSVHYHYLSPMSAGLFQNGISSSGTALSPWAYTDNPMLDTILLVKLLNCPTNNSMEIVRCLKQKSAIEIGNATQDIAMNEYMKYGVIRATFQPVAEKIDNNYFINRSPREIIKNGDIYDVPWIAGTVSAEGIFFTEGFRDNQTRLSYIDENWDKVGPYMLMFRSKMPESDYILAANLSRNYYLGDKPFKVNDEIKQGMIDMVSHVNVLIDVQEAVKLHSGASKSPVQLYYYNFNNRIGDTPKYGIPHCDDCAFVLSNDNFDPTKNSEITLMMERSLEFIYSVANGTDLIWKKNWPRVNPKTEFVQYVHINGPNNISYVNDDNFGERKFWSRLIKHS